MMTNLATLATGFALLAVGTLGWFRWPVDVRCRALHQQPMAIAAVPLPPALRAVLHAADVSDEHVRDGRNVLCMLGVITVLIGLFASPLAAVGVLVAVAALVVVVLFARRDRRDRRLLLALPDALELVSRSLRSGSSLLQALAEAATSVGGPLGSAFDRVVRGVQRGESLDHALQRFVRQTPLSEIRIATAALALAAESGAGPSRALDGVGSSLRDSHRLRAELGALTSQARTSALVLIALPFVFVAVNAAVDPSALAFLVTDDAGRLCLVVGLILDAVGWVWMSRLVQQVQT